MPDSGDSLNMFVVNLNLSLDKLDLEIVPFVNGRTGGPSLRFGSFIVLLPVLSLVTG